MNNKINDATMRIKQSIYIYAFAALLLGGCKSNNELTIPTNPHGIRPWSLSA